jgi:hypothetical protein
LNASSIETVTAGQSYQPFVEHHYYNGGLRVDAVSLSTNRPGWAPDADWVGFRDEIALDAQDRVLEVVKFGTGQNVVVWIGIFESALDQKYGDRKNHAGVGVWLWNGYPKEPSLLIDALGGLLTIAKRNEQDKFKKKAHEFLSSYLEGYIGAYEAIPSPFGGLQCATSPVQSSIVEHLNTKDPTFEEKLNDYVHRLFFLIPDDQAKNSRALLLLTPKDVRQPKAVQHHPGRLIPQLLSTIPSVFQSQTSTIEQLQLNLGEAHKAIEELDLNVDRLESELLSVRTRAESSEKLLTDLQTSLNENDELKRFSLLQTGIESVNNSVGRLDTRLGGIRQDIVRDVVREMRSIAATAPNPTPAGPASGFRQQHNHLVAGSNLAKKGKQSGDISWALVGVVVLILLLLILLLVLFFKYPF